MKWYKVFKSSDDACNRIAVNKAISVFIKAEDKHICLARTQAGFYAVDDRCPHMGVQLSKGVCTIYNEVTCPWHSYRFSLLDGQETTGNECEPLNVYAVNLNEEGLSIGFPEKSNHD